MLGVVVVRKCFPDELSGSRKVRDGAVKCLSRVLQDIEERVRCTSTYYECFSRRLSVVAVLSVELGEQCRGFLEIGVAETFSDAGDNRDETGFGFVKATMRREKTCEAGRGTQLPCASLLKRRNLQGVLKTALGLCIGA